MRILFISDYIPYPLHSGDRIRVYNLIRRLAEHNEVSLVGFTPSADDQEPAAQLRVFCHQVEAISLPQRSKMRRIPRVARYVVSGKPFELEFLDSPDMAEAIGRLTTETDFDIVHIEQSRMAPYFEALPADAQARCVLGLEDIAFSQYKRISAIASNPIRKARSWLHAEMLRRWEPRYAKRFARCFTVSEVDRDVLVAANPALRIDVVPNGVDTERHRPLAPAHDRPSLLFIGSMSYPPCTDGAMWFCNEVLPLIERQVPDVELWLVGNAPPPQLVKLGGDSVHVTGRVEDIHPYYEQCTISIVPLRAGGGTRLKILEALALGRPVVTTSLGCEGLEVEDGRHLLVADSPRRFAEQTTRLLRDPGLRHSLVKAGRELVLRSYDWDLVTERLLGIYRDIRDPPTATGSPTPSASEQGGDLHAHRSDRTRRHPLGARAGQRPPRSWPEGVAVCLEKPRHHRGR